MRGDGRLGRAERIVAVIAWTILAAILFAAFGMVLGDAAVVTLDALGLADREDLGLLVHAVRGLAGLGMLGISRLYRLTAGQENAGSVAAWLAGWTLVLYSAAAGVSLLDEQAAPVLLLAVLSTWIVWRISRYFAHYDVDEETPDIGAGGGEESSADGRRAAEDRETRDDPEARDPGEAPEGPDPGEAPAPREPGEAPEGPDPGDDDPAVRARRRAGGGPR